MAQPFTFQFGNWVPDLQNVTTGVTQGSTTPVPVSDCLNVYYQDGAYRCLPGPNPFGPAFPVPILNAFTWYDNVEGQEIVFAAGAQGIYSLIDNVIALTPFPITISVPAVGFNLRMRILGTNNITPLGMTFTLGNVVVHGGLSYSGTMVAGSGSGTGYVQSAFGSITPAIWLNVPITALYIYLIGPIGHKAPRLDFTVSSILSQNFFTSLNLPNVGGISYSLLTSSVIGFTQTATTTTWTWAPSFAFVAGNSYPVTITQ